ncbi:DUF998 domain-containing protein [Streptomyces sp. NPDC006173]|uniref:DUF998 domain-containing protein n=1 Tax=Streptomyces sp. NPDC006173 TaxID=3155349 RepID=UPI0033DBB339
MIFVHRRALLASGFAPVLLIVGWIVAGRLEGPAYDPSVQTISVLAAYGAAGYWVMTGTLLALGICYVITAWGLRPAALGGRLALAGGGVVALALTLIPAPSAGGSLRHGFVAAVGFFLMAAWPLLAARDSSSVPWALRRRPSIAATVVMIAGAAWLLAEVRHHGPVGVAERVVTAMQSLWPFVVVASCYRRKPRSPGRARH